MKILIMGSGGVGGYFGARLQQGGADVAFIARGKHLAAMKANGLTLNSTHGNAQLKVRAFEQPAEAGPADVVMFCVKLWDTDGAAAQVKPVVGPGTVVIPFQNGVESIAWLKKHFPEAAVMGGSAYIATRISSPGVIEHIGQMARLQFGPLLDSQKGVAESFLDTCRKGSINAELSDDIVRSNWEKFTFLVALSTATALTCQPIGVIRTDPDMRAMFEQAMRETWTVGRARGVALADDFVEGRMKFADTLPHEMKASMAHDLEAGAKLEAPWLCGAVARMAREAGLEAPVNATAFAALKPYVDGAQAKAP